MRLVCEDDAPFAQGCCPSLSGVGFSNSFVLVYNLLDESHGCCSCLALEQVLGLLSPRGLHNSSSVFQALWESKGAVVWSRKRRPLHLIPPVANRLGRSFTKC